MLAYKMYRTLHFLPFDCYSSFFKYHTTLAGIYFFTIVYSLVTYILTFKDVDWLFQNGWGVGPGNFLNINSSVRTGNHGRALPTQQHLIKTLEICWAPYHKWSLHYYCEIVLIHQLQLLWDQHLIHGDTHTHTHTHTKERRGRGDITILHTVNTTQS